MKSLSLDNNCPTYKLLNDFYKFVFEIQPSLLGFINSNFGKTPQDLLYF